MPHPDSSSASSVSTPHDPLTDYYAQESERQAWIGNIFNATAVDYDRIETILGMGSGSWYRKQALLRAGLSAGMEVVDVGVGTGLVARQAALIVGKPENVTGVDPSAGMLSHARVPEGVKLVSGRAEEIPATEASFDFLSMGYALRHISDLSVAFGEFHRVLRPGGRVCILEISCPEQAWKKRLLKAYLRGAVPFLAKLTARSADTSLLWQYYWDTIEACAKPGDVMRTLEDAGFAQVERYVELGVFSEYRAVKPG